LEVSFNNLLKIELLERFIVVKVTRRLVQKLRFHTIRDAEAQPEDAVIEDAGRR
jgi:hypothetical protein